MNVPRIVVPDGADRDQWMLERGVGVTASRAWAIARGGLSTWKREAEQQMNGSTFRGNAATRAGSSREAALLDEAAEKFGAGIMPNGALWAAADNDEHRATPDGIDVDERGAVRRIAEVKSHDHKWTETGIPDEHRAQMQWQMHVTGAASGLYGFEVRDEDDQPPLDGATWIQVDRDEDMIGWLVERADAYIAWRADGCPDIMPMPDDVADALAEWAPLKAALDELAAVEKEAAARLKAAVANDPHAARFGATGMGELGGFQTTVTRKTAIDETAWKTGNPDGYKRVVEARAALKAAEAAALAAFPKTTTTTSLRHHAAPQKETTDA